VKITLKKNNIEAIKSKGCKQFKSTNRYDYQFFNVEKLEMLEKKKNLKVMKKYRFFSKCRKKQH